MIPFDYITAWRETAPWVQDAQVEQDLVISRALVELFQQPVVLDTLAFRGGTALNKLFVSPPARYSEDIDLVQTQNVSIGPALDAVRKVLNPWLGEAQQVDRKANSVTLRYRFQSEQTALPLRLKIEINIVEQQNLFGHQLHDFAVDSPWFSGASQIRSFELDELLGTKLRALFQRRKGRDLFDLWLVKNTAPITPERLIESFHHYLKLQNRTVSRAQFEASLHDKLQKSSFLGDIAPLLAPSCAWNQDDAVDYVQRDLLPRLPGEPWKGKR